MALEITGKLISKLSLLTGTSKSGNNWQKQEFVIETLDQYPKKVCAQLWGDKTDQLSQFEIGSTLKVSFDVESREFNGKWYTDLRAWKIESATTQPTVQPPASTMQQPIAAAVPSASAPAQQAVNELPPIAEGYATQNTVMSNDDDLPF